MSIENGDVVTLKSGGPKMTVKHKYENENIGDVICQWFHGDEKYETLQEGIFSTESLVVDKD